MMALPFDLQNEPGILVAVAIVVISVVLLSLNRKSSPSVSDIKVYPVKSCAHIQVTEAVATDLGFENDRIAQVSDSKGNYCTPRDKKCAKLFRITTKIQNKTLTLSASDKSDLVIDLNGKTKPTLAVPMIGPKVKLQDFGDDVATWLQTATGIEGARLTAIGAGYNRVVEVNPDQNDPIPTAKDAPVSLADEAPYLLTSTSSLKDLNKRLQKRGESAVGMERFRPNIVISGLKAWEEDCLSKIRIGEVEFHIWQRCGRCAMTTIDRASLARGPEPLATLNTFRERGGQRNFGMHMIPVASTTNNIIRIGDKLEILEYDKARKLEWEKLFG
jgi:uncharacterized protein YcbX